MCDVAFCDGLSIDGGNTEGVVHGIVDRHSSLTMCRSIRFTVALESTRLRDNKPYEHIVLV